MCKACVLGFINGIIDIGTMRWGIMFSPTYFYHVDGTTIRTIDCEANFLQHL
jgi:hypothetical protein